MIKARKSELKYLYQTISDKKNKIETLIEDLYKKWHC